MDTPPVLHDPEGATTPGYDDAALADPRSLALSSLDGAEWHARRAGGPQGIWGPEVRCFVWATAAVVYALLAVAKAAAAPRRAK